MLVHALVAVEAGQTIFPAMSDFCRLPSDPSALASRRISSRSAAVLVVEIVTLFFLLISFSHSSVRLGDIARPREVSGRERLPALISGVSDRVKLRPPARRRLEAGISRLLSPSGFHSLKVTFGHPVSHRKKTPFIISASHVIACHWPAPSLLASVASLELLPGSQPP